MNNNWSKLTAKEILRIDADSKNFPKDDIPNNTSNSNKRKYVLIRYIRKKDAI